MDPFDELIELKSDYTALLDAMAMGRDYAIRVNALNANGHSLMRRVLTRGVDNDPNWARLAAQTLMAMGATVVGNDRPLRKMLERNSSNNMLDMLVGTMFKYGKENPLFDLAEKAPAYFASKLMVENATPDGMHYARFAQWAQETDKAGRTPAHYLWGGGSTLSRQSRLVGGNKHPKNDDTWKNTWKNTFAVSLFVQETLMTLGADPYTPDAQGATPMDLLIKHIEAIPVVMGQEWSSSEFDGTPFNLAQREAEKRRIDAGTAPNGQTVSTRPAPRI